MNENKTHQILPVLELSLNLAPHSQQDRKRRKGNQQNEDTNQTTETEKGFAQHLPQDKAQGKPRQGARKLHVLLLQSLPLHNGHGLEKNKK